MLYILSSQHRAVACIICAAFTSHALAKSSVITPNAYMSSIQGVCTSCATSSLIAGLSCATCCRGRGSSRTSRRAGGMWSGVACHASPVLTTPRRPALPKSHNMTRPLSPLLTSTLAAMTSLHKQGSRKALGVTCRAHGTICEHVWHDACNGSFKIGVDYVLSAQMPLETAMCVAACSCKQCSRADDTHIQPSPELVCIRAQMFVYQSPATPHSWTPA